MGSPDREGQARNEDRRDDEPQVVGTYDPPIASGPTPRADLQAHPDQSMVIETNRIRESDGADPSNLVLVPVEIGQQAGSRPDAGPSGEGNDSKEQSGRGEPGSEGKRQEGRAGRGGKADGPGQKEPDPDAHGDKQKGGDKQPSKSPSTTRTLLFSGVVATVCGLIGAFAYSYFFGPSKSDDQQSSGKDSGSGKKAESGQDSGSGKDSRSGKGSNPGQGPGAGRDGDMPRNAEEGQALMAAMREIRDARGAEKAARQSADQAKAALEFFKATLLSAGRPGGTSLAEAFWSGGQGKDVTLRKAVDMAASKVAEAFTNRPLVEASVRETLGLAYINLGDAAQSVKQYEQALALRRAIQGFSDPEAANCRNQLAVAYRLAGRPDEGARLFDSNAESPTESSALAARGMALLDEGKPGEAELKLRACLEMRQKSQPDDWATFDAKSTLGEALLDQGKYADAEPILLSGYEGLKHREDKIPPADRPRLTRALERLVKLYDAWGKKDDAARWKERLEASRSTNVKA